VLTADICPTLLELAGVPTDPEADGRSLVGLLASPDACSGRVTFGETPYSCAAIAENYKYIYYAAGGQEQLFDVVNDPDDMTNLARVPERKGDLERLRSMLVDYLQRRSSDLVSNGSLVSRPSDIDPANLRRKNSLACRGPMRGGMGY
jgi:arylsulfatase A-like enzyme